MSERSEEVRAAYASGRRRFLGVELEAAPGALVPREETELLGRTAVELLGPLAARDGGARGIDMATGSGNLACALAFTLPGLRVWASDSSDACVALARRNVLALGLAGRVEVLQGDLFASLAGLGLEGTIDAVVCNPPYISSGRLAKDRAPLLELEPREAFDGGPYGLSLHQRVIADAAAFLRPGGSLLCEIGEGQHRQVALLVERAGAYDRFRTVADGAGTPRVIVAARKES